MKFFNLLFILALGLMPMTQTFGQCSSANFLAAPANQQAGWVFDAGDLNLVLSWDAYPNATDCYISGNFVDRPNDLVFFVQGFNGIAPTQFSINISHLGPIGEIRWKVLCGCSYTPVVASPYSVYTNFSWVFGP